ncbi:hypothetical protein B0H13DRAFT_1867048 [Mycena leptocephala]|nr:hypothetical protein B0H13DRAFT_1867048 [Mycena leptocephala]
MSWDKDKISRFVDVKNGAVGGGVGTLGYYSWSSVRSSWAAFLVNFGGRFQFNGVSNTRFKRTGPVVYDSPYPITVTEDGVVVFPSIELDEILPATLHHLLEEFFEKCWKKFLFPFALKEPQTFTTFETLAIAEFLNSPKSAGFHFKNQPGVQPDRAISPPLELPPPSIRDNVNPPPLQELPLPTLPADSPPPILASPSPQPPEKNRAGKGNNKRTRKETSDEAQVPDETATKKKRRGVARPEHTTVNLGSQPRRSSRKSQPAQTSSSISKKADMQTKKPKYKEWVMLSEEDEED